MAVLGGFRLENFRHTMAGLASKMAIPWSRHIEMCGNPEHRIRDSALLDLLVRKVY